MIGHNSTTSQLGFGGNTYPDSGISEFWHYCIGNGKDSSSLVEQQLKYTQAGGRQIEHIKWPALAEVCTMHSPSAYVPVRYC